MRKYVQVAYPGLHTWRGELACDRVYMVHKTLVEAADGVPARAMAGALEGHCVVEQSGCVVVHTAELERVSIRGAGMKDDAVALLFP
jgi:hypothetical protein